MACTEKCELFRTYTCVDICMFSYTIHMYVLTCVSSILQPGGIFDHSPGQRAARTCTLFVHVHVCTCTSMSKYSTCTWVFFDLD